MRPDTLPGAGPVSGPALAASVLAAASIVLLAGPATPPRVPGAERVPRSSWLGALARRRIEQFRRPGRQRRRDAQLPEALDRVASALRSGASLAAALREAATLAPQPLAGELRAVVDDVDGGCPLSDALERWADEATPPLRLAAAALGLGAATGGSVARAVDGVAQTLRDRRQAAGEVRALATQARASAGLLAVAPLGFAALVAAADPASARLLLGTPVGLACLVAGLALQALGAMWMARIVREAT